MNTCAMVVRLNELDGQLCSDVGISRRGDATTLGEAIAISAAATGRALTGERGMGDGTASPIGTSQLIVFLQAQVEARVMRDGNRGDVVRSLTNGIRRMKKAGSLQGLARQACTELCALGFDKALLSFVEDDGFVVEETDPRNGGPTVIRRRGCVAERDGIRLRDTVRTNESDVPATSGYAELLGSAQYVVAPVIAESRVVALLHVCRRGDGGVSARDIDVLDTFASACSLLHARMLTPDRGQKHRTSIPRASGRRTGGR